VLWMVSVASETCQTTGGQILGNCLYLFPVSDTACLIICWISSSVCVCVFKDCSYTCCLSNFPTEKSYVVWYLNKQTINDNWFFCLKMLRMLAIHILAVRAVHSLAVTKSYYTSRHLIMLNNAIILPIYRSKLTLKEYMVLHLEIKPQS
jgi:hypothetical protein